MDFSLDECACARAYEVWREVAAEPLPAVASTSGAWTVKPWTCGAPSRALAGAHDAFELERAPRARVVAHEAAANVATQAIA